MGIGTPTTLEESLGYSAEVSLKLNGCPMIVSTAESYHVPPGVYTEYQEVHFRFYSPLELLVEILLFLIIVDKEDREPPLRAFCAL